jgi:phosphoglycolate phosphatase-like HAD superfamily hydrolase
MSSLVALDLDGTLLDCRARQVALARSLAPGLDEARFWAAKRAGASTCAAFERLGIAPGAASLLATRWTAAIEDDGWLEFDRPLPRATAALRALRDDGHLLVLVTARRRVDAVRAQVERLGLGALLNRVEVVDPRDPVPAKAAILRSLGASAFIGDTESDARAATLAGARFLGVASGQRSAQWLAAEGVAPVFADIRDAGLALATARETS